MTLLRKSNPYLPSFWDNFLSRDLTDWGLSNFSSTDTTLPAVNVIYKGLFVFFNNIITLINIQTFIFVPQKN